MPLPREKMDFYKPLYPIARELYDHKYDRAVVGSENIPDGPAVYAPNHIHFDDSPLVAIAYTEATGVPLRFGAKREYFDGKGIDDHGKYGRIVRWVMEHGRMISVDRENTGLRTFQELQQSSARALERGDAVALHPEGTRSEDGRLHKFKAGAARIALMSTVPIVPVGLVYESYSNGRKTHADIIFGEPLTPEDYSRWPYAAMPTKLKTEAMIQEVENRVAALTGMEQTGTFAVLRKLRPGRGSGDEISE